VHAPANRECVIYSGDSWRFDLRTCWRQCTHASQNPFRANLNSCLQNSRRSNPVRSSVSGVVTPSVSFRAATCPTICFAARGWPAESGYVPTAPQMAIQRRSDLGRYGFRVLNTNSASLMICPSLGKANANRKGAGSSPERDSRLRRRNHDDGWSKYRIGGVAGLDVQALLETPPTWQAQLCAILSVESLQNFVVGRNCDSAQEFRRRTSASSATREVIRVPLTVTRPRKAPVDSIKFRVDLNTLEVPCPCSSVKLT